MASNSQLCAMIDTETLSNKGPSTAVLSLAAVIFDRTDPETNFIDVHEDYYDWRTQLKDGRTQCQETLAWWKKQDQSIINKQFKGTTPVQEGLIQLKEFLVQYDIKFYYYWNSSFDQTLLRDLSVMYDVELDPVKSYWKTMCCASICREIEAVSGQPYLIKNVRDKCMKKFMGSHDAVSDCKAQIETYKEIVLR